MNKRNIYPVIYGILTALLFGTSTPLAKLLLKDISPILLTALLYLGSAIGLFIIKTIQHIISRTHHTEAELVKADMPYLLGAILAGGIIAPLLLMVSLHHTAASVASLMLNFEVVSTMVIAVMVFKEHIGLNALWAIISITIASILLSWDSNGKWDISINALGILGACVFWGIDNNLTRKISAKDPVTIVMIKGISAGIITLVIALAFRYPFPEPVIWLKSLLLGSIGYGLSIVFFVLALRGLGAARAGAFFGIAPFAGAALSFIIFRETPNLFFIIALPLMILGVVLLINEKHIHKHVHPEAEHQHRHCHDDDHHLHEHKEKILQSDQTHSHEHQHPETKHDGYHLPDIHHSHEHDIGQDE